MTYTLIEKIELLQEQLDRGFRNKWMADIVLELIEGYRRQAYLKDTQNLSPNNHHYLPTEKVGCEVLYGIHNL